MGLLTIDEFCSYCERGATKEECRDIIEWAKVAVIATVGPPLILILVVPSQPRTYLGSLDS
jgi:predicted pyridoxine 5'-phosphate oxidase superfamily flavin-nucleotide-binding protein